MSLKKPIAFLTEFQERVYKAVKAIPKGKVASYSYIAQKIGSPGAARAVGNALNKNRFLDVPCHRVVRQDGFIGGYAWGREEKIRLLEKEGIRINKNKIVQI